ncbi:unnamed protein product [Orchesella dallaii]|uniref:Uncharacterized protein n=1 Tax=Orchesella dallaii TaxID=48710 RepID=A0ABP1R3J0_9HEXA
MSSLLKQEVTAAEEESARASSSCESEILRNRLMCSSGSGSNSSTGSTPETTPVPSLSCYPKCNISLTSANEQLTVITSVASASGGGGGESKMSSGGDPYSSGNYFQPKTEIKVEDVKPVILNVNQASSSLASYGVPSSVLVPPMRFKQEPVEVTIKAEPSEAAVEIPYDRERILNFLTDYWKSKNLQQVTEAQLQTAGVGVVLDSPAPQRIVEEALFDLFVEYPMMIDGLQIPKRSWAKAFYEKDIIQTSKVLFEALFSELEMQQCTLNGKKGTPELSAIKMLAILRAAAWMKNKKQDPYSFNTNISSHNQFPTNEEREKIEKKVFTERRSQANRKITKTTGGTEGGSPPSSESSETHNQGSPLHNSPSTSAVPKTGSPTPPVVQPPISEHRLSFSEDLRREHMAPLAKIPKLDLDTEVVKQLQMLYADSPEGLISYLLPNANSILIDGFLIPHEDWTKAYGEAGVDIVKAAWTLFKVLFSKTEILNCTLNGKNGTKELCPVKKLAILRAVTWMKETQGTSTDIFTFNVRRSDCNCFPSDEDKDKIETKVYTEKRYQACRKLKGQQI